MQQLSRKNLPSFPSLLAVALLVIASLPAHSQEFTSIVVFGDSLSDSGNVADLYQQKYGFRLPVVNFNYADGHITDGYETIPGAQNYAGTWVEQLAAALPSKPKVKASLDGGTNYAYGFATTGSGLGYLFYDIQGVTYSVNVSNIGQQITDYLATNPKMNGKTLFVLWGGGIDLLYATSPLDIYEAGVNQAINVQRLVDAGATNIMVANLPAMGLIPRLNGDASSAAAGNQASALFNGVLDQSLDNVEKSHPGQPLHLYRLDIFTLFNQMVASPSSFSLTNVTNPSIGINGLNPDTYLFWDDIHPTTKTHNIVALTAAKLLDSKKCWGYVWPYPLAESERSCAVK
jgi:phospholipase/lecithinase/hemolysin